MAFLPFCGTKLKAGIFDGPQIWQLIKDSKLENLLNTPEYAARKSGLQVANNLLGNYECSKPRHTHQQHDRRFPKTWLVDQYKDTFPVLTHGEVSWKPWGNERQAGKKAPSGHAPNEGYVTGKLGYSQDSGLLLTDEERQPSSCLDTEIKETLIYPVKFKILCHVTLSLFLTLWIMLNKIDGVNKNWIGTRLLIFLEETGKIVRDISSADLQNFLFFFLPKIDF